jgi:CHAT domain-containing protein
LRVLLIGSDAGGVPRAETEVTTIKERLSERFRQLRWPRGPENLKTLVGSVDRQRLKAEISFGGFDLLHIAGHGEVKDTEPGLRLKEGADSYFVSSQELAAWVSASQLRFTYLSCCRSGAAEVGFRGHPIRRFDNLIQAFVKEAVPEVLGFLWPIRDDESSRFAEVFYTNFRHDFRAASALLKARKDAKTEQRIWAAPVLYSQSDTQYT